MTPAQHTASRAGGRSDLHGKHVKSPRRLRARGWYVGIQRTSRRLRHCTASRHGSAPSPSISLSPSRPAPPLCLKPVKAPRTKLDLIRLGSHICSLFLTPDLGTLARLSGFDSRWRAPGTQRPRIPAGVLVPCLPPTVTGQVTPASSASPAWTALWVPLMELELAS